MTNPFFNLDLKEKIENVCLSPYEWSQNLICLAFKNKIVVGIIKFIEEFDEIEQEVEFEQLEEFYHGQRVHALSWSPLSSLNKLPKSIEICAASSDFSLRVFASDLTSKRHSRKEIEAHLDYINDCAYDPEGDYLASVSDDLTCKLWTAQQYDHLNTFNLTSPGMSVCWHTEQPNKLLVGEKQGVVRLYNTLSLQPISCVLSATLPLTSLAWSSACRLAVFLAGGHLVLAHPPISTLVTESKLLHPGGASKLALCPANENYAATICRAGQNLKVTHIRSKQSVVCHSLEMFGGFSWHPRLPYLCVGNNANLSVFKVSPK